MSTTIQWTDETWNPIRARDKATGKIGWHCTKPSAGCKSCYAEAMNKWRGTGLPFVPASRQKIELFVDDKMLLKPIHWRRPRKVFVCDMTDLFQEDISDAMIDAVFSVICQSDEGLSGDHHIYQILTKRPERMHDYAISRELGSLPNVWLGVSCEDQATADERIPILLQTPTTVRWISAEPLLQQVDLRDDSLLPNFASDDDRYHRPGGRGLDWVVVGGESGPGARPCDIAWIRSLKDQCQAAGVPVFVKQLGSKPSVSYYDDDWRNLYDEKGWDWPDPYNWDIRDGQPALNAKVVIKMRDKKGGDPTEWPEDLRVREYPYGLD